MVLGLVERERIAAVSVDVASDPAFSLPRARGLPRVRAEVERVLALRPTLVVRSYGGGPRFAAAMEGAGVPAGIETESIGLLPRVVGQGGEDSIEQSAMQQG